MISYQSTVLNDVAKDMLHLENDTIVEIVQETVAVQTDIMNGNTKAIEIQTEVVEV